MYKIIYPIQEDYDQSGPQKKDSLLLGFHTEDVLENICASHQQGHT